MVVADAESPGPVRKKARLSLKKGSNYVSTNTPTSIEAKEEPLVAKEVSENLTDKDHSIDGDTSIALSDSTIVPVVCSLENLGNTCFLNSVLQVLRFTPGFLDRLDDLYQELVQTKKSKKQEIEKENDDEAEPFKIPQTCELVKFLHKHYRSMERREEKHPEVATADVMSMALKPERILNTIRELNPMFEGCLQHDAQELLRCILCYLQDAEKEVLKLKESLPPAILPQSTKQIHPIMQNFLTLGRGDKSRLPKGDNSPVLCTDKVNGDFSQNSSSISNVNLNKSDILEQIDPSETAMTGGGTENISPVKNPECQIADEPIGSTEEKEHCKKSNNLNIKKQGKRKSPKKRLENLSGVLESACTGNSDENGCQCEKEVLVNNFKSECQKDNQPSILTMLKGSTSCKRLGMRGAVLKTKENENSFEVDKSGMFRASHLPCKNDGIKINNTRNGGKKGEQTDRDLVLDVSTSSDQMECDSSGTDSSKKTYTRKLQNGQSGQPTIFSDQNGIPNTNKSPVKSCLLNVKNSQVKNGLPFVKLENCDHVCNSPEKSVSAAFATKTLSPLKLNSPKSNMATSVMTKLDFYNNKLQLQSKDIIKKKDLVEKLFMGTLMLRTTCMECECSRERIEEFHDISVAVRKEKKDESDDEDEDENKELGEEEEKGTSLPKLMESFSEVERLKGDNKYFCDNCKHLTEAERSLHYNVLPDVLSVHLKRFSTASGIFGHVSKINDHVRIPLSLPCLRHKCPRPCSRSDHRYRLYALIAHAGVTLTSGHYLAYVRVNNTSMQETRQSGSQSSNHQPSTESPTCAKNNLSAFNSQSQRALSSSPLTPQGGKLSKFVKIPTQKYEECWLECDDETVKVYSEEDFCQMLKADEGSLLGTPYVLFYHRQNV